MMKLRPTLIVGSVPFKTETVQKILALPVPFLALNPRSLADVEADIRMLGRVAQATARAEALIQKCEEISSEYEKSRNARRRGREFIARRGRIRGSVRRRGLRSLCIFPAAKWSSPAGQHISDEEVARRSQTSSCSHGPRPGAKIQAGTSAGESGVAGCERRARAQASLRCATN